MAGDHGNDGVEWLDDVGGPSQRAHDAVPPGRRRPRWAPWVALLAIAAVVAGMLVSQQDSGNLDAAAPSPARTAAPPAVVSSAPDLGGSTPAHRTTRHARGPILGITGDYDLFAVGHDTLVRVQFAAGRVTTTPLPGLSIGAGYVSFVVGTHAVVVESVRNIGFLVPDDAPPTGPPVSGLPALPGPDGSHLWVWYGDLAGPNLRLTGFDGTESHVSIDLPTGFDLLDGDGDGYVLVTGPGGVYDARPTGLTRITTGSLLATGRNGWLVRDCDTRARCTAVYVHGRTGERHSLGHDIDADGIGAVAPDGSHAAVRSHGTVVLVNLRTGVMSGLAIKLPVALDPSSGRLTHPTMAWSPNSRWLFVATGTVVQAVELATGRIWTIGAVPAGLAITQVAVRPG